MITDQKYTFVIVDDHPFTRVGVNNFVSADQRFHCIGEFGNTRALLNSNFPGRPDLIILDLNLPGIDGERSCLLLKQRFPGCKVVAFTQYGDREKDLIKLGFDGYVVKSESEKDSLIEALLTVARGGTSFKSDTKTSSSGSDKTDAFLKMKQLTPREIEVAKYIMQDFSNKEIGEKIFISESTVETHRKHIKEKLQAKNRRELFAILRTYEIE